MKRTFSQYVRIALVLLFLLPFGSTAQKPTPQDDEFFVCPMHADVTSYNPGQCAKCGMTLVRTRRPEADDYLVEVTTTPQVVKPGETFRLSFQIMHPKSGALVKNFNIVHEMPFHLFLVSQDLNYFAHLHPTLQRDGTFVIDTTVPKEGSYFVYCDIFPVGGMPQVVHRNLVTAGLKSDLFASQARLEADKTLTKTAGGVRFEVTLDPVAPVAGKGATLKFRLSDEKSGEPVKDLQPYLGAWGHALMLSEDASDFYHSHTTEAIPDNVNSMTVLSNTDVSFKAFFPRAGRYRVWSQFQRQGKLITVDFTIEVRHL
jgi:Heavy metal binding domain